jgi:hypothetical protein
VRPLADEMIDAVEHVPRCERASFLEGSLLRRRRHHTKSLKLNKSGRAIPAGIGSRRKWCGQAHNGWGLPAVGRYKRNRPRSLPYLPPEQHVQCKAVLTAIFFGLTLLTKCLDVFRGQSSSDRRCLTEGDHPQICVGRSRAAEN